MGKKSTVWKEPFNDSEFHRGKIQPFCKNLKKFLQRKRHLLYQQASVDRYRCFLVGMWAVLLKMGAPIPCNAAQIVWSANNAEDRPPNL